ncbi:hypothetical protein [Agromyces kandeliae]|uniref:Uncharacterized protein n=1 Tax=Agromyces kandeliae TaxID=2666141 RepID=A0A6L5R200_9MICO|nr:hypothetical protein [Agromyces kandeliae]MRX44053.1 hypothetical protein [Agromyces kandeliae]
MSTYRRVGTMPDGASIHVARNADATQVCLHADVPEVGGTSTCTDGAAFPADGMYVEGGFESGSSHVEWSASGEVSFPTTPAD